MGARQRFLGAAVAVCALICALPTRALASTTQESILMDDDHLIYASPHHVAKTMERIAALGVDRIKVSIVWSIVAPDSRSPNRPRFDASDPASYPAGAWDRYDLIVRLAQALGLKVYFELNPPAPAWAVAKGRPTQGYAWSQQPSAQQFGQFVEAVGRRYGGDWVPTGTAGGTASSAALGLPVGVLGTGSQKAASGPTPIPRVDYWGIWNEPNEAAWLNPQWRDGSRGHRVLVAPALYRGLVDAAWSALSLTHHASDTILIGETASRGWILPTPFVEALYCVSSSLRPLRGNSAANVSCPQSGNRAAFVSRHPGLFDATGYGHHPYSFDVPPDATPQFPGQITVGQLAGFERVLDGMFRSYGRSRPGGVPLYLTEWGYKTNPPNPFVHTSQSQQAVWLNQGEYMTFSDPHVRALTQFLLFDDRPRAGTARGTRQYWSTPQTGLLNINGTPKPALAAFRIPIWLPVARHGNRVTVWGQLRPANHKVRQYGTIDYRHSTHQKWRSMREVVTSNPRGFFVAHVAISRGYVRVGWLNPATDAVYYSRAVRLS